MRSAFYADALARQHVDVHVMVSLETLGHYSGAANTQKYPALALLYPDRGDFVTDGGHRGAAGTYSSRRYSVADVGLRPIGLVLGRDFVHKREVGSIDLADFPHDEGEALNERVTYELTSIDQLTNKSFQRIYQDVRDDD